MHRDPRIAAWFATHQRLPAIAEAGVEGSAGAIVVDGEAARLSLGCYELFAGEPASAGARRLVATAARRRELVYDNDARWRQLILDVHGGEVFDRPMQEYEPPPLDRAALARTAAALPPGLVAAPLDEELATQLDGELEPHGLQVYASAAALAGQGLGQGVVDGRRLVAAATSYTRSSRYLEVAIATRPSHRGQGLAAAAAAGLLLRCHQLGLRPRWSASNPVSQRLALRLGFRAVGECEVLCLR